LSDHIITKGNIDKQTHKYTDTQTETRTFSDSETISASEFDISFKTHE